MFSLKQFHIFFIAVCIAFAFGFAGWAFHEYHVARGMRNVAMGIGSLAVGVALIVYLKKVYSKI